MRLSKFLAFCGFGSRRKNIELILSGKVVINGIVVKDLSHKVDPEKDRVFVDGKEIKPPPKVYYLFYKPRGYITSLYDPHHRKTIKCFLEKIPYKVFPVGRLDKESEGLLLLTNDGDLANTLLHPKYEIKRTYLVWVNPKPK
ncbi:MAG: pseudouridine synthase, partial [Caldimicrobium sp.]